MPLPFGADDSCSRSALHTPNLLSILLLGKAIKVVLQWSQPLSEEPVPATWQTRVHFDHSSLQTVQLMCRVSARLRGC